MIVVESLAWLYEIGSLFGIIFFAISFILIIKIKQLFPGGRILRKWTIIQILVVAFGALYIVDWIVWILAADSAFFEGMLFMLGGLIRMATGVFIILIIWLFYRTYNLILMKTKSSSERNE